MTDQSQPSPAEEQQRASHWEEWFDAWYDRSAGPDEAWTPEDLGIGIAAHEAEREAAARADEREKVLAEHIEAHKVSRDLAFEGALLIEWVRQVVGGFSMPTAVELGDLFEQCSDYSDKWNSGNTQALPDPRGPTWEEVRRAIIAHDEFLHTEPGRPTAECMCGHKLITTRPDIRQDFLDHRVQAVLAIMLKPTDPEETK